VDKAYLEKQTGMAKISSLNYCSQLLFEYRILKFNFDGVAVRENRHTQATN